MLVPSSWWRLPSLPLLPYSAPAAGKPASAGEETPPIPTINIECGTSGSLRGTTAIHKGRVGYSADRLQVTGNSDNFSGSNSDQDAGVGLGPGRLRPGY